MKTSLEHLSIRNSDLPKIRIREHIRTLVESGALLPGSSLPSTRRLSSMWNVTPTIIHKALAELVEERLLIRRHGKGTFVAEELVALRTAGLYMGLESMSAPAKWFVRRVLVEVQRLFSARGVATQVFTDTRPASELHLSWHDLEQAVERKEIQGLILLDCDRMILKGMKSLSLPLAALAPDPLPFGVGGDSVQMFEMGMRRLAERGCRTVGLITVHTMGDVYRKYFGNLIEKAAQYGLGIENSWIRLPEKGVMGGDLVRFGYDQFLKFWNQKNRPDGLMVEPDAAVEGVIMAMMQLGVRVPEDLKVVFHRNEKHDYLCPFPVDQVVTSESAYAEALVRQIEKQIRGETFTHMGISYQLAEHPGEPGYVQANLEQQQ